MKRISLVIAFSLNFITLKTLLHQNVLVNTMWLASLF